jgi:hypothetical protein
MLILWCRGWRRCNWLKLLRNFLAAPSSMLILTLRCGCLQTVFGCSTGHLPHLVVRSRLIWAPVCVYVSSLQPEAYLSRSGRSTQGLVELICILRRGQGLTPAVREQTDADIFFFICIVGGGVQTGSTRHVGHLLAYCTCPG